MDEINVTQALASGAAVAHRAERLADYRDDVLVG
jgi:hypothetical protein